MTFPYIFRLTKQYRIPAGLKCKDPQNWAIEGTYERYGVPTGAQNGVWVLDLDRKGDKENSGMGLRSKFRQWIEDAKAVWRSQGATRPFTRRGMTEADLLEGYKHRLDNAEGTQEASDRHRSGKKHDHE